MNASTRSLDTASVQLNFFQLTQSKLNPEELSDAGSHLRARDCVDFKVNYDRCFRNWYRYSYLRKEFDDPCASYFQAYHACLKVSLQGKGLGSLMNEEEPIWKYQD